VAIEEPHRVGEGVFGHPQGLLEFCDGLLDGDGLVERLRLPVEFVVDDQVALPSLFAQDRVTAAAAIGVLVDETLALFVDQNSLYVG
jgi:hypothetical protein